MPVTTRGYRTPVNIVNTKSETITVLIIFNISVTSRQIQKGYDHIDQFDADERHNQAPKTVNK